jgi:hypothetical protein
MADLIEFLIFWAKHHPVPIVAGVVAFFVLTWLLNRKSAMDRDADRVVKNLVETSRDKYKDVRPLR